MMSEKQRQADSNQKAWSVEGDAEVWNEFSSPTSSERFYQAWLGLLCRQLPDISTGVVLVQSEDESNFQPVAVWPSVSGDLSYLGQVAERALLERRGVVHRDEDSSANNIQVAYPIEVADRVLGAVVLEGLARPDPHVHSLLRQLHWGMAWLHNHFNRAELEICQQRSSRIGSVMEIVATSLRRGTLQQVLFEICNHIVQYLDCSRVAIGLTKGRSIRVSALSNSAWMEKSSSTVRAYKAAMMDVLDFMEEISFEVTDSSVSTSVAEKDSSHARLASESGAKAITSIPLTLGAECIGVITLEHDTQQGFSEEDRDWVDALVGLLPAIIDQRKHAERGYFSHLIDDLGKLAQRFVGPGHLVWKFTGALLLFTVIALAVVDVDYRVSAKTVVEGELERVAAAPFDGYIKASYTRPGDTVKKGQVLCRLDDSDLQLEQKKWDSEREQYSRKLREAIANHKMSDVQVLTAQLDQAEAQYNLVSYRLEHVEIKAPFDGVVISGDLSQLINSPVELGEELFEIAPLDAYRVVLQVDESDMRFVEHQQRGKLMISGIVGEPIPFSVNTITPMATAADGRNFFRVEAVLDQGHVHLRPGMEGIGKISVGEFGLWWVLTHSFTDWLRLTVWKWMP